MKTILISLFLFSLTPGLFSQYNQEQTWLEAHVKEIKSLYSDDFSDLQFLKEELKGKRIVQLGESSHGIGDYYNIKSRLVKFLHKEMGFNVLAMEGGFGDINLANIDRDSLSAQQLMGTLFGNFQNKEMLRAFTYMKSTSNQATPLQLAGFDCQSSSNYFEEFMSKLLDRFDPSLSTEFQEHFSSSFTLYGHIKDSVALMSRIEKNEELYQKVKKFLHTQRQSIHKSYPNHPHLIKTIEQTLETFTTYWDFSFEDFKQFKNSAIRDELMAQNFIWLSENIFPDEKIIIWAHNAHVHKGEASWTDPNGNKVRLQGEILDKHFKNQNYVLGIFSIQGETYQHWTRTYVDFDHREKPYLAEYKFKDLKSERNYLPLSHINRKPANEWLFNPVKIFQVETNGEFLSDPLPEIYDAIMVLDSVSRPTLLKN